MAEAKDKKIIAKLKHVRENLNILEYGCISEKKQAEMDSELIMDAKAEVNDLLYELTGDEFYRRED